MRARAAGPGMACRAVLRHLSKNILMPHDRDRFESINDS